MTENRNRVSPKEKDILSLWLLKATVAIPVTYRRTHTATIRLADICFRKITVRIAELPRSDIRSTPCNNAASRVNLQFGSLLCSQKGAPVRFHRFVEKLLAERFAGIRFHTLVNKEPADAKSKIYNANIFKLESMSNIFIRVDVQPGDRRANRLYGW